MPAWGAVLLFPFSPSPPSSPPLCDTAVLEVWCRSPGDTERVGITSSGHKNPSSFSPYHSFILYKSMDRPSSAHSHAGPA